MERERSTTVGTAFLESARQRFAEYKTLGDKTLAQLTAEQFHVRPNATSNSIAIIIQHLHGNMLSRWTAFLTEDGEKPGRNRDAEFEAQPLSQEELGRRWNEGWTVLFEALATLTEQDLLKNCTIRGQPLLVLDAINRQLAHYSGHVGQMVYLGKWLRGDAWQTLSIAKEASQQFNNTMENPKY